MDVPSASSYDSLNTSNTQADVRSPRLPAHNELHNDVTVSLTITGIRWTAGKVFWTLGVFILAGLAEIGGGWLVWQTVRNKKPWYYAIAGAAILVAYGFVPTLQPEGASFARVYAVYGGVFIVMSYGWGWALDGDRPDRGDWVGGAIALAGVAVAWFWPRA